MNTKKTSKQVASLAAKTLQSNQSSKIAKKVAASALSQVNGSHQTGKNMETKASEILQSSKYSSDTKIMAASILSQSNKKR
jgi:hypothetical protein